MKEFILIILLVLSSKILLGQNRLDSLTGSWTIKDYKGSSKDRVGDSLGKNCCPDFLTIKINKEGEIKFIFKDKSDSRSFYGKIWLKKNNTIKVKNSIHEILYLGKLEECISASLRMKIQEIFYGVFNFSISQNQLSFYYNYPTNLNKIETITFLKEEE